MKATGLTGGSYPPLRFAKQQLTDDLERPFPMESGYRIKLEGLESRQVADEDSG